MRAFDTLPQILLIEPDGLVRSTVAAVCREMRLAQVHQAAHVAVGRQLLDAHTFDAWLVSTVEGEAAIGLIERLRAGQFFGGPGLPVAAMTASADRAAALKVQRLLLQPFKIRDVVQTVETLGRGAPPSV